jgi:hypothetical protein
MSSQESSPAHAFRWVLHEKFIGIAYQHDPAGTVPARRASRLGEVRAALSDEDSRLEPTLERSGSFRAWLKTVTFRAWRDYVESHPRFVALDTTSAEAGQSRPDRKEAMAVVKHKVQERTWEA